MPKVEGTPQAIRPYIFHGVDLTWSAEDKQAKGDCPFCGKAGKFSVEVKTGVFKCWVCGTGNDRGGGNSWVFLRRFYDMCSPDEAPLRALAEDRGLLDWQSLSAWGVAVSPLTGEIVVPGHNADGLLCNIYRYTSFQPGKKRRAMGTAGVAHQLFGMPCFDRSKPLVYLCEGPWDGIALWEALGTAKRAGEELVPTSNPAASLLADASVIAVPGANVFNERWASLLDGKHVVMCFHSDHPPASANGNGKHPDPAGFAGAKRLTKLLTHSEGRPKTLSWIAWGPNGYDPSLAPGYDVRDALKDGSEPADRCRMLADLLAKIRPVPDEWTPGRSPSAPNKAKGEVGLDCMPCQDWKTLINAWRKPMKWTEGLNKALACMLASVVSTMSNGDQLWLRVLGPPACGKSTLCEALSVNRKYIHPKSTLRGMVSGFNDGSGENHSPVEKMRDMTLIVKDGDTLLKSPNLDQILSELRDLYDRVIRTAYRNKQSKDFEGLNLTIILCGTGSMRVLDTSELGERFLTVVIAEGVDPELEDEILWRKINQAEQMMNYESSGDRESQYDPAMLRAMQLTGGYVAHLRQNAQELLRAVHAPEWALRRIVPFAKFVSYLRARPSKAQEELVEREFSMRLGSQLTRLAKGLAVVLNKESLDEEVLEIVRSVVIDSSKGRTFEIAKRLAEAGREGLSPSSLAILTNQTEDAERKLLRFMRKIGAVETFIEKDKSPRPRWRLTRTMVELFEAVVPSSEKE